jgi:hypothetical protein
MFVSSAQAQIGDWEDVKNIPSCTFDRATNRALFCTVLYSFGIEPPELSVDRRGISQVSFDNGDRNTAKGALIGGGIGATIGASLDPGRSGYSRLGGAFLLGGIGSVVGHVIAMDHPHYRVVYKR